MLWFPSRQQHCWSPMNRFLWCQQEGILCCCLFEKPRHVHQSPCISCNAINTKSPSKQLVLVLVLVIQRYSNYMHLIRVTSCVFQVVSRSHLFSSTPLSVSQLYNTVAWLSKQAQVQMFPGTVVPLPNPLCPLNPFPNADRLLGSLKIDDIRTTAPLLWFSVKTTVKTRRVAQTKMPFFKETR